MNELLARRLLQHRNANRRAEFQLRRVLGGEQERESIQLDGVVIESVFEDAPATVAQGKILMNDQRYVFWVFWTFTNSNRYDAIRAAFRHSMEHASPINVTCWRFEDDDNNNNHDSKSFRLSNECIVIDIEQQKEKEEQ